MGLISDYDFGFTECEVCQERASIRFESVLLCENCMEAINEGGYEDFVSAKPVIKGEKKYE